MKFARGTTLEQQIESLDRGLQAIETNLQSISRDQQLKNLAARVTKLEEVVQQLARKMNVKIVEHAIQLVDYEDMEPIDVDN